MSEIGPNSNKTQADSNIERCPRHGGTSCRTDNEQGELWIGDVDEYFDCVGVPGSTKEKLHWLRWRGLVVLEKLAENFATNPEVVDAVEWVRDYVSSTPLPDGDGEIICEGREWWSATDLWDFGRSLVPHLETASPSWLLPYEVTEWLLEGVELLRRHAAITQKMPSLFDHILDSGGLGHGSASNGRCTWS